MSKQHIVKSVFWLTISEVIFNLSGYIVHSGVGRILGPADYGRYGLVVTLTTMIIVLIGNGVPTAMSKYLSEFFETNSEMIKTIKRKTILIQAILMGAVTVIFFLLAPWISKALGDSTLTPLFQISTLIIPTFAAASFYFYYFTGIHHFNLQAILKTVRSVAKVIFILGFAWLFGVKGSIAGYIVAPLFVFIIALGIDKFYISRKFKLNKTTSSEKFDWKTLVNYAWPMTLFMLFYEIMISIDLYMVKALLETDFLTGIYNGALTIGRIPYYLFYALTIVLLPTISKTTSQNQAEETKKVIDQTIRLLLIFLFPGVILMSVFAEPIVDLFYGSEYIQAAFPMSILVFGVGFLTIFYVLSFAINGAGKVKIPMYIALFGAILNSILNYILIAKYGLLGAATATSVSSFATMVLILYFTKKYFNVSIKLLTLSKVVLASIIMYLASLFFPATSLLFIFWALILFVLYFIILYALKEFDSEDIKLFRKLIKKS